MSEREGTVAAHEAYAFACMRCGHGWEQSFDIEHHVDGKGEPFVVYKSGGKTVPSPLTSPTCPTCEAHVVRIMRSGRVARYRELTRSYGMDAMAKQPAGRQPVREAVRAARSERAEATGVLPAYDAGAEVPETVAEPWHPHLPEFLRHLFHHQHAGHPGGR